MKDIHDAVDIAWSTVGTVTPAGQQKLLLDFAAKSQDSKSSHSTMNVEGKERGGGYMQGGGRNWDSGKWGGGGGGRGTGEGGARVRRDGDSRGDVDRWTGQDSRNIARVDYPPATHNKPIGRAFVGKI